PAATVSYDRTSICDCPDRSCCSRSLFRCCLAHRDLHSFPTRRSSDLKFCRSCGLDLSHTTPVAAVRDQQIDVTELDLVREQLKRSEEHTSELQSPCNIVCRLLLEKKTSAGMRPLESWKYTAALPTPVR